MLTDERIEEIQINYLEYGQEVAGLDFARAIEAEVRAEAHYLKRELDISDGTVELLEKQNKELQAKVAELETKWLEEQARNLAEEADYEIMSQKLANAEAMAEVDADMNQELRIKVSKLSNELDVVKSYAKEALRVIETYKKDNKNAM